MRLLRGVLPARRAGSREGLQRQGLSPAVPREAGALQRLRHVRALLPRLLHLRLPREARAGGLGATNTCPTRLPRERSPAVTTWTATTPAARARSRPGAA